MGRRLYVRLYLAFLGVLLAMVVVSALTTAVLGRNFIPMLRRGPRVAAHLARTLPPPGDLAALARAVEQAGDELGLDVAVVGPTGEELASSGSHISRPGEEQLRHAERGPGWIGPGVVAAPLRPRAPGGPPGEDPEAVPRAFVLVHIPLPDATVLHDEHDHGDRGALGDRAGASGLQHGPLSRLVPGMGPAMPGLGGPSLVPGPRGWQRALFFLLGGVILSAALLYPLSRTITRPLERLAASVEAFGKGDLSRRSGVVGSDEVGRLASAFDEMAARIETARRAEKELLANVSHELRTPLQRVKLTLELIEPPPGPGGDALRARLVSVAEEIDELTRLVSEVLTASKLDLAELPLRKGTVDLREALEKARARSLALSPEPELEVDAPAGLIVLADETLLGRVFDNLIDNARKYGGKTKVRLEARGDAAGATIVVTDGGPGFPPEELPRVFETFFRGSNARGKESGYGLGLSLARRVAVAHGGSITAQNAPGGGARIELRLPAAKDAPASAAAPAAAAAG